MRDTAKRHRLNTEHKTMIAILVMPGLIPLQYGLSCEAMLVEQRHVSVEASSFSPHYIANLFTPPSLNMSDVNHGTWYLT